MTTALVRAGRVGGRMVLATALAAVVSIVSLRAIGRVQWPAFPSSNQLHALTTVGQFVCLAALVVAGWLWRRGRRWLAEGTAAVFLTAFVVTTLGMPLGATKLYLFGISVDQQFRTEYLTRLTDSAALRDMTYAGLPPFYPPGWFWIGGRAAALTGTPGWEMVKPWSVTSIAIAVVLAFVLWNALVRFEYALIVLRGSASVAGTPVEPGRLVYLGAGASELPIEAPNRCRAMLLGGVPFEAPVVMFWNFVGRDRAELAQAGRDWNAGHDRYGRLGSRLARIPAPDAPWPGV